MIWIRHFQSIAKYERLTQSYTNRSKDKLGRKPQDLSISFSTALLQEENYSFEMMPTAEGLSQVKTQRFSGLMHPPKFPLLVNNWCCIPSTKRPLTWSSQWANSAPHYPYKTPWNSTWNVEAMAAHVWWYLSDQKHKTASSLPFTSPLCQFLETADITTWGNCSLWNKSTHARLKSALKYSLC